MESKLINRRDLEFILYELLNVESLTRRERFADHSRETFDATIELALQIATEQFATHSRKSDLNEPTFDGKTVSMIPEVAAALKVFFEAGLMAASQDYELGGMQLPHTVTLAMFSLFNAANIATAAYPFLTGGNANLIKTFGSDEQKKAFLPHLLSGRFFGTMCLSEPQAGSSLGDIRTTAFPQRDGTYRIVGNKMWISGGEHDLSENIIHLVLAKIKDAPPGVKGISLFIVPKYLVNVDGVCGDKNDVALAGLNHKMGYRGTTNCVLNFGEKDGAIGYLIGEPNKGLSYMFHMMNESRIGVGLGATMLGYTGYLHSLDYARSRPQGRLISAKNPQSPQVPIVQHTDVKRMLLAQKAYVEASLALCLYSGFLVDEQNTATDETTRKNAGLLLDILTPIVKSWPSQWCLEANNLAIQIHGGYGYTREYPVEQFYRDNRLNPIHEGTHGIQGLDVLGRKVTMQNGAAFKLLVQQIQLTVTQAMASENVCIIKFAPQLESALKEMVEITALLTRTNASGEIDKALANASVYLESLGHLVMAWMWLRQGIIAAEKLNANNDASAVAFFNGKLQACTYFFSWELPKCATWNALLAKLDTTCLDMRDEYF